MHGRNYLSLSEIIVYLFQEFLFLDLQHRMFETIRVFVDVLPFLLSIEFLFQLIMFSDLILRHFRNRGTHDELAIFRVIGKLSLPRKL